MKESVAIAKEADTKKGFSPTKSDKSIHRVQNEPERQLGSLRSVIDNIRCDGGTPSVESIATELSSTHTAQRAPVLLALQRTHGNRYVQRVVAGIQAKLKVGQPGDIYEQEADRVAEQVMQMPEPQVQRQLEEEEEEEEELIQTKPPAGEVTPLVQRQVEEEEEKEEEEEIIQPKLKTDTEHYIRRQEEEEKEEEESVQTKALDRSPYAGPSLQKQLAQSKGGGSSLSEHSRAFMESMFGTDFSDVRVHTDSQATEMAKTLNAQAFTSGKDIYFGASRYSPRTTSGDRVMS